MILGPPDAPDTKRTLSFSSRTITGLILDCGLFPGSVRKIDVISLFWYIRTSIELNRHLIKYRTMFVVCTYVISLRSWQAKCVGCSRCREVIHFVVENYSSSVSYYFWTKTETIPKTNEICVTVSFPMQATTTTMRQQRLAREYWYISSENLHHSLQTENKFRQGLDLVLRVTSECFTNLFV